MELMMRCEETVKMISRSDLIYKITHKPHDKTPGTENYITLAVPNDITKYPIYILIKDGDTYKWLDISSRDRTPTITYSVLCSTLASKMIDDLENTHKIYYGTFTEIADFVIKIQAQK